MSLVEIKACRLFGTKPLPEHARHFICDSFIMCTDPFKNDSQSDGALMNFFPRTSAHQNVINYDTLSIGQFHMVIFKSGYPEMFMITVPRLWSLMHSNKKHIIAEHEMCMTKNIVGHMDIIKHTSTSFMWTYQSEIVKFLALWSMMGLPCSEF